MTNGNDSAYPVIETQHVAKWSGDIEGYPDTYSTGGMSKREYFAAMAQQAVITDADPLIMQLAKENDVAYEQAVAQQAVLHADALIEALNK